MRRKIPSTAALIAFEMAARHESFTRAAEELALTQSAVCRQIASLEEFVGLRLFKRTRRGVKLTEAGLSYSRQIGARLDAVERDTLSLMAHHGKGVTLELGVVPTFATRWLIPRLASFHAAHPEIVLNFATRTRPFMFSEHELDAAIYYGDAVWPGTEAHFLMYEDSVPVCSPKLLNGRQSLTAAEIATLPLLQQTTRPYAWRSWFESLGMRIEHDMTGIRMELFSMLAQAAIEGMGVALMPPFLIREELDRGQLVVPFNHACPSSKAYYLMIPEHMVESVALQAFRAWLCEEARRYRESGA
jgi:LysR family glycine cleavage system transcriptional activator